MTLHAAKGLEFENVFIVGLEQNILPHERSSTSEDDLEEERRLLFVGITRAKSGLHISLAQHRLVHGMLMRTIPSQFLFEIGAKIARPQMRRSMNSAQEHPQDDILRLMSISRHLLKASLCGIRFSALAG